MRRLLVAGLCLFMLAPALFGYTVDDLGDAPDATPGDNICATAAPVCTLRAAIMEANAHLGADSIDFSVAGTITPATALPPIGETVAINAMTAPGYVGAPVVVIDGAGSIGRGLTIMDDATGTIVRGLEIHGFTASGIFTSASDVIIQHNYIGPVSGGTPNLEGLELEGTGGTVGGAAAKGNVISGNTNNGILVRGTGHTISGNFIGTDVAGTAANGNDTGILIDLGSTGNFIGTAADGNVISGNLVDGIDVFASNTIIRGNFIGTDVSGTLDLGNGEVGVYAETVTNIDIGGTGAGEGNVISSNLDLGILTVDVTASRVEGNTIGLDATKSAILPNGVGIGLIFCDAITVGSNVISGNDDVGIGTALSSNLIIENNLVGTNAAGSSTLGNFFEGMAISASTGTTVRSNVVAANLSHGIEIDADSADTIVHSNIVGISADLATPLGNFGDGVNVCEGATGTVVGSVALGGNTIANNLENGIGVEPTALLDNSFEANSIFDNGDLGIDLSRDGVTPNDPLDADTGPNNLQNFPILIAAVTTATASQIRGTIDTTANTAVAIHVYSSAIADPSGNGEGEVYRGTVSLTTDGTGAGSFTFNGPAIPLTHQVTATATAPDGTSEFSAARVIAAAPTIQFSSITYAVGEAAGPATITLLRTGDVSAISTVQFATSNNTATAGVDYTTASGTVTFNPGDTSATFNVPITNDGLDELDEIVNLTLSNATAASLGVPSAAQLAIVDDDLATADLTVAKTASSATFTPNQQITFTTVVTNGGPVAATGVVVTDTLPAGLTFVSVSSATASCGGTTTVTCSIPAIAVSGSATISLVASASGTTPITNVASVSATESDPVPANNSSSVAIAPVPPAPVPTLSGWMLIALALMLGLLAVRML
ncbi:MAG: right-handed parallel beta-helix repeat-containing protein [Thermoanaerobaculia bacterium]|nr:right-handed parallel beta-helix repeat-containing protein [Thermoanaerobaculia bacterium]